jgi:hypothetical protein
MKIKGPFEPSSATAAQTMTPTGFWLPKLVQMAEAILEEPPAKILTFWEFIWSSNVKIISFDQMETLLAALLISSKIVLTL